MFEVGMEATSRLENSVDIVADTGTRNATEPLATIVSGPSSASYQLQELARRHRVLSQGSLLGPYEIVGVLGSGGMGHVYRATDLRLKRDVAIKALPVEFADDPERLAQFEQEGVLLASLNHPNIAAIYDVIECDGVRYLVLEFVEGQTLDISISAGAFHVSDVLSVAQQVADALKSAHSRNIVHRDIKPSNLAITAQGMVKVLDFGIAKAGMLQSKEPVDQTKRVEADSGLVFGTPAYMSPEQASGQGLDHRADIFSLGIVLYELATSRKPFSGLTNDDTVDRILNLEPTPIRQWDSRIPQYLEEIIARCIRKNRDDRYQTAQELLDDLAAFETHIEDPDASLHNLPAQLTSFVGRKRDIKEVKRILSEHRLLTLTGPGGIGKTRLALEVLGELASYPDGIWFVELASVVDPSLLLREIASSLGIPEEPNRAPEDTMIGYLKRRHLLLVLDNCEQILSATSQFVDILLRACPHLQIVSTSREVLGTEGEIVWRVGSLEVSNSKSPCEAAQLFLERTASIQPHFSCSPRQAQIVFDICQHLDGIPLAIELASAQMRVLSLDQIRDRLTDRFELLTSRNRNVLPRQKTLQATIDWSYNLLSQPDQILFRRLSAFAGGWTLEAAEKVCAEENKQRNDVLNALSQLVDKSLVLAAEQDGAMRYRMLETILQYARARLLKSGESEFVFRQHLNWFVAMAERENLAPPANQAESWNRMEEDHDNIRAALNWAIRTDTEAALRLASAVWPIWNSKSHFEEVRFWLRETTARNIFRTPFRVNALIGSACCALNEPDLTSARSFSEEAVRLAREIGDKAGLAGALNILAKVFEINGYYVEAGSIAEESLTIFTDLNNGPGIASSLHILSLLAYRKGDYSEGRSMLERELSLHRQLGDQLGLKSCNRLLALFTRKMGEIAQARSLHEETLKASQESGNTFNVATEFCYLGRLSMLQGDLAAAWELCAKGLSIWEQLGLGQGEEFALRCLGNISLQCGNFSKAGAYCEEALKYARAIGAGPRICLALDSLGNVLAAQREYAAARSIFEEALEIARSCVNKPLLATLLHDFGVVYFSEGDNAKACSILVASFGINVELGDRVSVASSLTALAGVATVMQEYDFAARQFGLAETAYESLRIPLLPHDRVRYRYDSSIAHLRACVSPDAVGKAWAEGRQLRVEDVLESWTKIRAVFSPGSGNCGGCHIPRA